VKSSPADPAPDLFGGSLLPEGLLYSPDFISADEERELAGRIAALPLRPFEFRGFVGKRRTASFGLHYRFEGAGRLEPARPIPDWLEPVRIRAAALAGLTPDTLRHVLLIEYDEGAGIGWHRDRPEFGVVIGISLLAPARLRFRRRSGTGWQRCDVVAKPRSAYLLRGPARGEWEHSIPAVAALRYSITLRTIR
jgi:DNA oxidative demethylase